MNARIFAAAAMAAIGVLACGTRAQGGTLTTLHVFQAHNGDGCQPALSIISGALLYGTTPLGGHGQGQGPLFSLDPATGTLTHVHDFTGGKGGQNPNGVTLFNGLLYGVTPLSQGPANGNVFSVDPTTGDFRVVHQFIGDKDGAEPSGTLSVVNGLLFGGTVLGGLGHLHGGVFSVDPATRKEVFAPLDRGQGKNTGGPLLQIGNFLYSTAAFGGSANAGTIFTIDPATYRIKKIHTFEGSDGATPDNWLTQVGTAIFGTTSFGGLGTYPGNGVVFKLDLATGKVSVVHQFGGQADGRYPFGPLTLLNGLLYGMTVSDGAFGFGTIYTIDPASGAKTVIYDFTGGARDNGAPNSGLIYQNGVFYGTTGAGPAHYPCGTAFSYVP